MNLEKAILDTDTLLNFFDDDENTSRAVALYISAHRRLTIAELTIFEILRGLYYRNATKRIEKFDDFLSKCEILPTLRESIKISSRIYAELKRKGISIGEVDILIAGIAIQHNLELITNNLGHFRHIEGLQTNNWK